MEADWVAKRSMLRHLITLHPTWTPADLATCLGHSESWVKKWRRRFKAAAPDDQQVLRSRSRARQTPPPSFVTPHTSTAFTFYMRCIIIFSASQRHCACDIRSPNEALRASSHGSVRIQDMTMESSLKVANSPPKRARNKAIESILPPFCGLSGENFNVSSRRVLNSDTSSDMRYL